MPLASRNSLHRNVLRPYQYNRHLKITNQDGTCEAELLNLSYIDLTHPDDREQDMQIIQAVLPGNKKSWTNEKRYIRKDRWFSLVVVPVPDQIYFNVYGRDITEYMHAQEQLTISEQRYALAQRGANIGTWEWHIPSGKVHWSEQIEPMFGLATGSFDGTYASLMDYVHPDDRKRVSAAVEECLKTRKDYNVEHRIVSTDYRSQWPSHRDAVCRNRPDMPPVHCRLLP
jgi:PAS domain-containing protein